MFTWSRSLYAIVFLNLLSLLLILKICAHTYVLYSTKQTVYNCKNTCHIARINTFYTKNTLYTNKNTLHNKFAKIHLILQQWSLECSILFLAWLYSLLGLLKSLFLHVLFCLLCSTKLKNLIILYISYIICIS